MNEQITYNLKRPGYFAQLLKFVSNSSFDGILLTFCLVSLFSIMSLSVGVLSARKLPLEEMIPEILKETIQKNVTEHNQNIASSNLKDQIATKAEQERLLTLYSEMRDLQTQRDALLKEKKELASIVLELPDLNNKNSTQKGADKSTLNGQGGSLGALGNLFSLASKSITDNLQNKNKSASNNKIKLEEMLTDEHELARLISSTPIGTPALGRLTSEFGIRRSPFEYNSNEEEATTKNSSNDFHTGIDIAAETNTPVVSSIDGTVIFASRKGSYGRTIVIKNEKGYETLYAHLARMHVKIGDTVTRGQKIGAIGSSGRSTGPHLHYEIRHLGSIIDPKPFIEFASKLN